MIHSPTAADERYATLVASLLAEADVTFGSGGRTGFGSSALKTGGKIFAMLLDERLVLKLPRHRVDALVAAGEGCRFVPGHGRPMKEWVAVPPQSSVRWEPAAREAMEFVASSR